MLHMWYFIITSTKVSTKTNDAPQENWMLTRNTKKIYEILEIHPQKALSTTFHHIFYQNNKIVVYHLALMRIL